MRLSVFKESLIGLALVISLAPFWPAYAGSTFFEADFELGWGEWSSNPVLTPNANSSLVPDNSDLAGAPAGSQAAQQLYKAGWTDGGGVGWMSIGKAALPTHFLMEYDFKVSSNFHWPLGHKWMRMMPDMNTGQLSNDTAATNYIYGYGTELWIEEASNSTTYGFDGKVLRVPVPTGTVTSGVWHRIGYRFKKNTFSGSTPNADGQVEIFYDGVSLGSRNDMRLTADPTRWFRDYWGGPGNYTSVTDNNPIPQDQWIRIDSFKITDLTGTASPSPPPSTGLIPSAPSRVTIQ